MAPRTKIICTIGPAVSTLEKMLALIDAGMNVARLNFSHGTHEDHRRNIRLLKQAREKRQIPLAIMLDTKGPEIRLGEIEGGAIEVKEKQKILLTRSKVLGNTQRISITPPSVLEHVAIGSTLLFDDGYIQAKAVKKVPEGVYVEICNPGMLKSHKSSNIPGAEIALPAMTAQDNKDIALGCEEDVDVIAASFIRSAEHVMEIKNLLQKHEKSSIKVFAKIENAQGVENFDQIVQISDGIIVARGDLGVELPLKKVPMLQKMMIRKCLQASKPVVTATQMLESMIKNPRPTRAEVSDVANAIFDSTSVVMLSGETAMGEYPIECCGMMRSIAEEAEKDFNYLDFFEQSSKGDYHDISTAVALATAKTSYTVQARCIFVYTSSGFTARLIARFRPQIPILALTADLKVYHQMAYYWGVTPIYCKECKNAEHAFELSSAYALKKGLVDKGDLVIVTSGYPFGVSGTTNNMRVESIGNVALRGKPGHGEMIRGKVALLLPSDEKKRSFKNRIVILSRCEESMRSRLKDALGIILQNHPDDTASEAAAQLLGMALDIPFLVRADGAMTLLQEGQEIALDPAKGVIFIEK